MADKKKQAEADVAADEEGAADGKSAPKKKFPLKLILMAVGGLVLAWRRGRRFLHDEGQDVHGCSWQLRSPSRRPSLICRTRWSTCPTPATIARNILKVKIVLELPDQTMVAQVQPVLPRVMDSFQTYLRELRPTDLDGSAGLYRLKEELTRRVNNAIVPNRVNAVLFKEIVVQ